MTLGEKIKSYLITAGIKQSSLAARAGMTENALCLSLNGNRKLTADEYSQICNVLGVAYERFLDNHSPTINQNPPA